MEESAISEQFTPYEQACLQSIDDLYHIAYIALVDTDDAEKLVTATCVSCIHRYNHLNDVNKIRYHLTSNLYRRIKRKLRFYSPDNHALPEPLQILSKHERLLVAMRFSSELPAAESGRIIGLPLKCYQKLISKIMQKIPLKQSTP